MAAKKAPAKAPRKTGKGLIEWEEKLAVYAEEAADSEQVGSGKFISLQGGIMSFNGATMDDNMIDAVVIDHMMENAYYDTKFDADNPQPPACYAYGRKEKEMAPHEKAQNPQGGAGGKCEGCEFNEWGTADTGRGKACRNTRRLALISAGDLDDIENAPVAFLRLPVTSVAEWSAYVHKLQETMKRPPFSFVTNIKLVPDKKSQFRVLFKVQEKIDDAETFEALIAKRASVESQLFAPYAEAREEEAPPPRRGNKAAPKKAPAKKAAGRKF